MVIQVDRGKMKSRDSESNELRRRSEIRCAFHLIKYMLRTSFSFPTLRTQKYIPAGSADA